MPGFCAGPVTLQRFPCSTVATLSPPSPPRPLRSRPAGPRPRQDRLLASRLRRRHEGRQAVLIDVSAPWCPTCKAQAPILSELTKQPRFKNLVVFNVDFDSQKDALRGFKAQQQSTLIVFKGGAEMGRSVGDTNKASIEALLARAI